MYIFSVYNKKKKQSKSFQRTDNGEVEAIRVLSFNVCCRFKFVLFNVHRNGIFPRCKILANETLIISDRNPFIFSFRQYENNFSFLRRASQLHRVMLSKTTMSFFFSLVYLSPSFAVLDQFYHFGYIRFSFQFNASLKTPSNIIVDFSLLFRTIRMITAWKNGT